MSNWDLATARRYHERTKHSFESVRRRARPLDWSNRPNPFKEYLGVESLLLPDDLTRPAAARLEAPPAGAAPATRLFTFADLARLLRWGAGVTRTRKLAGGETYHFRSYSSAGALYPIELYVAGSATPGIAPGLYHFHPHARALRPLRRGDPRGSLAAAADAPDLAEAAAVLILTGILWRSAWKYQARAYRHLYWDAGTMLANLLALAAPRFGPQLLTAFVDASVNRLLGIDGEREAALALLPVGRADPSGPAVRVEPLRLESAPLSREEVAYPDALDLHAASSLAGIEEIRRYRSAARRDGEKAGASAPTDLEFSQEPIETVIRRRGSVREFSSQTVPVSRLAAVLAHAAAPIPADVPLCNEIFVIANAVDGLASGTYRFAPPAGFELLRQGNFRLQAGYLCLEQPLGALAAATVFLLADLDRLMERLGNRGYRAAQLEAGIRAGRVYLGAYASGLAATASTFYDDDVTRFLAPGSGKSPLLCVAVGIDARAATP